MALTMAISAFGPPGATSDVFQAGDHYLFVDAQGILTLWEESNGADGLQATPVMILGVRVAEPDHRVHL